VVVVAVQALHAAERRVVHAIFSSLVGDEAEHMREHVRVERREERVIVNLSFLKRAFAIRRAARSRAWPCGAYVSATA